MKEMWGMLGTKKTIKEAWVAVQTMKIGGLVLMVWRKWMWEAAEGVLENIGFKEAKSIEDFGNAHHQPRDEPKITQWDGWWFQCRQKIPACGAIPVHSSCTQSHLRSSVMSRTSQNVRRTNYCSSKTKVSLCEKTLNSHTLYKCDHLRASVVVLLQTHLPDARM